ncbi:MAG: acyl-CoA thioesterase [Isosphaeraceae bacterium]|nr:acyl-CoA thioesterase [Isosphaeraceae bacterium]
MSDLTEQPTRPADSRVRLAFITEPAQANFHGTLHGGVLLKLADECGAIAALRHAGEGRITTAAIDSFTFLGPVHVGELVDVAAEVTHVGRTSLEARIEIHAESLPHAKRRKVAVGYGLYVALDAEGKPRAVPPLRLETEADFRRDAAARSRQAVRLARRAEAKEESFTAEIAERKTATEED